MHRLNLRKQPEQGGSWEICEERTCRQVARYFWPRATVTTSSGARCAVCHGSKQRRSVLNLAMHLRQRGISRLLILGGAPRQRYVLESELAGLLELQCIAGDGRGHTRREANPRLHWADLLVVWSSTVLSHKISHAYTATIPAPLRVVTVTHRGVEALCREVVERLA
jgi:hypothetical protein